MSLLHARLSRLGALARRHPGWVPAALLFLLSVAASCGDDGNPHGMLGTSSGSGPAGGPCTEGATRDCSFKVAEYMDIVHCAVGERTCVEGLWSECVGTGDMVAKVDRGGAQAYALSLPGSCSPADPCDPSCIGWVEIPVGLTTLGTIPQWQTGGNPPPAGNLTEPCIDAYDCQANHKCVNPARERDYDGSLANDGLVVRYFIDEAASGTAPTRLRDSADSPQDLNITYASGSPAYGTGGGGRGFAWAAAANNGRASIAVSGTKIESRLNGTQQVTQELVLDIDAVSGSFSRLVHIGNGSATGDLVLASPNTTTLAFAWEAITGTNWSVDLANLNRIVIHLVIDTTQATAADRIRLYVNGVLQAQGGLNAMAQNDTLAIDTAAHYVIGNKESGALSPQGAIYYVATYRTALGLDKIRRNVSILSGNDDSYTEHSKCATGGPLLRYSDRCVTEVCAANATCCQQRQDCYTLFGSGTGALTPTVCDETADTCYLAHQSVGGTSCAARCAAGGGTCVEMYNNTTDAQDCGMDLAAPQGCSATTLSRGVCVCTKPGAGTWDAACVQAVHTTCGAVCESPSTEDGSCVPWTAGETDADCGGLELTLASSCTGNIAVCNVGTATAPAGVELIHYPGTENQFPSCTPNQTLGTMRTCTTSDPILPGTCINVTSCTNLGNGVGFREVMVNPPGGGNQAECHPGSCKNNWLLHDNAVACAGSDCVADVLLRSNVCTYALPAPTTLIAGGAYAMTYDNGSGAVALSDVGNAGGCTTATTEYYTDNNMQPTQVTLCPATCANKSTQADVCVAAGDQYDGAADRCYNQPAGTALWTDARTACQAWSANGDLAVIRSQAEQTFVSGLVTAAGVDHWIGGFKPSSTDEQWRWVTGEPWDFAWWGGAYPDGAALQLEMESGGAWDDGSSGLQRYVCERHQPLPKTITFNGTCNFIAPNVVTEIYEGACAAGEQVVWGLLAWDATTPSDSNVQWEVRTADTIPDLAGSYVPVGTTTSTPDNQLCAMSPSSPPAGFPPPPGSCPVDLFTPLAGVPEATRNVLQLRIEVNPSTNLQFSPVVDGWQIRHSCVAAE